MSVRPDAFTWAVAHRPQPGQTLSGDAYIAELIPNGMVACVVDGLGHGEKAHEAATKATQTVLANLSESHDVLFKRTHHALTGTRGVVMSHIVVDISTQSIFWAGVGNVAAVLLPAGGDTRHSRRHLLVRGGIVGYRLPTIKVFTESLRSGDTIILATDGLKSTFLDNIPHTESPQNIAEYVLNTHARDTDDALTLVIRYHPT